MKLNRYLAPLAFASFFLMATLSGQTLFEGDGSSEPGFVAPIEAPPPPAPRASVASAETFIANAGPTTPQARSEQKNNPRPPVMFTKIRTDLGTIDWATRPNDLNNLLTAMAEMIDVHYSMEVKSFAEISTDPAQNPILYRTGHFRFSLSDEERVRLREYLLDGGMLILNAGMGSKPFYDAAIEEMRKVFPELAVTRLQPDHPIFHSYYDLSQVDYRSGVRKAGFADNAPWFDAIELDCRVMVLISRWGMDIGWDALDDDDLLGYEIDDAKKLGINIMSYATAQQAWLRDFSRGVEFVDAEETGAGAMHLGRVIYDGDWRNHSAGLSVLLHQFNQRTEIPVRFAQKEVELTDPALFDLPMIFMSGSNDFRFTDAEVRALRQYLARGGMLFAEACCGRQAFDVAFRREIQRVMPQQTLQEIPADNLIFHFPNAVQQVGVTPALEAREGAGVVRPQLHGMRAGSGYSVIYSRLGLSAGWQLAQDPYSIGLDDASALHLGTNILMYALTQ